MSSDSDFAHLYFFCVFFFFKQKTAYEIGTGDWSSDVCSSDLRDALYVQPDDALEAHHVREPSGAGSRARRERARALRRGERRRPRVDGRARLRATARPRPRDRKSVV